MKKFNILLLLSFFWLATSCDDKAEMNYVKNNDLTGTWKITEIGRVNAANGIDYEAFQPSTICGTSIDNIVFNGDLSFVQNTYADVAGTCEQKSFPGTYTQDNHALTLVQTDMQGIPYTTTALITKLDKTNLELNMSDATNTLVFIKFVKE